MARSVRTFITSTGGVRKTVYLPKVLTEDSRFPLKGVREVIVRIRGKKLVVEAAADAKAPQVVDDSRRVKPKTKRGRKLA